MLNLENKIFYIAGVANKKSVAYFSAKLLLEAGARVIFSAQNENNQKNITKLFPEAPCFLLDIENPEDVRALKANILKYSNKLDGMLHSMAFANFDPERRFFHQTKLEDFLQACHISSFSLVQMSNELIDVFGPEASIVTVGISNTKATNYGYLGPVKAMLASTVDYLAKSLSHTTKIRVNCVSAGPLKTSASAGIPDYIENYLYAEQLTLRKSALQTKEVAETIRFLLSPNSSGINSGNLVIDAGMNSNYFDQDIVRAYSKSL